MAYRGSALTYRIRKATTNNRTGDNYSITIPREIAKQFLEYNFTIEVSGNALIFQSGCKLTKEDIQYNKNMDKIYFGGTPVRFN